MLTNSNSYKTRKPKSIGDTLRFMKNPISFIDGITVECDNAPLIQFKTGPLTNIYITDEKLIREMLNAYEVFEKTSITYSEIRKMFDNGIIFSNREEWRHQRKIINPAFHKRAIEGYFETFAMRGKQLAEMWKKHEDRAPLNIYNNFVNTVMDITLDVFFNHDLSAPEKQKIVRGIDDMLKFTQRRLQRGGIKMPDFIPVPENLAIARARKGYHEVLNKIFHDRSKAISNNENERITILDLLWNSDGYGGGPMTRKQIIAEASSIMLAGTETTASLLTWLFFELGKHQDIQKKVKSEIASIFEADPSITPEKMRELKYCRQVINEVLRLYPPAWLLTRCLSTDASLGGVSFKKNTTFYFSPYFLQRKESVWQDPKKFNPDRFHSDNLTDEQKAHFLPFIMGPRKCIGEEFSIWEALVVMVQTIPHFEMSLPPHKLPSVDFNATMRPLNEKGEYEVLMSMKPVS